jgi:hypothetical protein
MNKIFLIFSLLVSIASGCTLDISRTQKSDSINTRISSPSPLIPSFDNSPQNQATNPLSIKTPTSKPFNTLSPTSSPIQPTVTPLALPMDNAIRFEISPELRSLNLQGHIWIRLDWKLGKYLQIDFENGDEKIIPITVPGCVKLLPKSSDALCQSEDQTYLVNMLTRELKPLPITAACWDAPSPDGGFLSFEECKSSGKDYIAQLYDLEGQIVEPIAHFYESRENRPWNTDPVLSFNGGHLVIQNNDGIFEISGDNNYKKILDNHIRATEDMAWSPTENILLFGATDIDTEVGSAINHLFLYDAESGETSLLFKASDNNYIKSFLNQEIWSPDGKQLALILDNYEMSTIDLCLLTIDPIKADCRPIANSEEDISIPAWSPDSKFLVFEQGDREAGTISIKVYPVEMKTEYTLLTITPETNYYHDLDIQRIFWRSDD